MKFSTGLHTYGNIIIASNNKIKTAFGYLQTGPKPKYIHTSKMRKEIFFYLSQFQLPKQSGKISPQNVTIFTIQTPVFSMLFWLRKKTDDLVNEKTKGKKTI